MHSGIEFQIEVLIKMNGREYLLIECYVQKMKTVNVYLFYKIDIGKQYIIRYLFI